WRSIASVAARCGTEPSISHLQGPLRVIRSGVRMCMAGRKAPRWQSSARTPRIAAHLHLEARRPEARHRLLEVVAVARLDDELEQRALGRQVGEDALVVDLDDVGAGLAQEVGDPGELARPVGEVDGELGEPALAGELAREHAGEQPRVDVAAG